MLEWKPPMSDEGDAVALVDHHCHRVIAIHAEVYLRCVPLHQCRFIDAAFAIGQHTPVDLHLRICMSLTVLHAAPAGCGDTMVSFKHMPMTWTLWSMSWAYSAA